MRGDQEKDETSPHPMHGMHASNHIVQTCMDAYLHRVEEIV